MRERMTRADGHRVVLVTAALATLVGCGGADANRDNADGTPRMAPRRSR